MGFKTAIEPNEFIKSWTPFANSFKKVGIKTIDLYQVLENNSLTFISRNVWEKNTYFQNFPSGIAGGGSGGGVVVTQFGGYRLQPDHLERQNNMILAFLTTEMEKTNSTQIVRLCCSENIPYKQMLDILPTTKSNFAMQINCKHLKQM